MTAACIAWDNLADDAAVTFSSQELLLPASNLQNENVGRKWRSLQASDYVVFGLASSESIDTVGVFGINAETVRVRVSSVDSTGVAGDLYDSGTQNVDSSYNQFIGLLTSAQSGRYVRIDLATSSDTFVEAGRVFFGVRTQFGVNFGYNWERGRTDLSIRAKTRGGQTQIFPDRVVRTISVNFGFLTETEADGFIETIEGDVGLHSDVLFIVDPASTNLPRDSYWGLITDATPVVNTNPNIFSKQYKIEERL